MRIVTLRWWLMRGATRAKISGAIYTCASKKLTARCYSCWALSADLKALRVEKAAGSLSKMFQSLVVLGKKELE